MLRLSRAAVLASLAVAVTASAHALGGGHAPGPVGALVLTAVLVLPTARLLGRPASALRVLGLLGAAQVSAHLVWTVQAAGPATDPLVTSSGHHGAAHPPAAAGTGHGAGWLDLDGRMLAVHVGATLLLGLWLAAGERHLWELLRLLAVRLTAAVHRLPAVEVRLPAGRRPAPCARTAIAPQLVSGRCVARRGPPAFA